MSTDQLSDEAKMIMALADALGKKVQFNDGRGATDLDDSITSRTDSSKPRAFTVVNKD